MTNWKEQIEYTMKLNGETFDDVVECTLTEEELLVEFNSGYGGSEWSNRTHWVEHLVMPSIVYFDYSVL